MSASHSGVTHEFTAGTSMRAMIRAAIDERCDKRIGGSFISREGLRIPPIAAAGLLWSAANSWPNKALAGTWSV